MLLCEEYSARKRLSFPYVRHADITHVFFAEGTMRMTSRWKSIGPRPGFFEICEFKIGSKTPTETTEIQWEEFHSYATEWCKKKSPLILDRKNVLFCTWNYFVIANDSSLATCYDPMEIYSLSEDSSNVCGIVEFIEKLSNTNSALYDFWNSKCVDILTNYGYWMGSLDMAILP